MHPTLRNVLALIVGLVIGSIVNMGLITVSGHTIPPPAGADVTTSEGLKAAMHLFEPKHFVFPFLAHALGTLAGAAVARPDRRKSQVWDCDDHRRHLPGGRSFHGDDAALAAMVRWSRPGRCLPPHGVAWLEVGSA